MPHYSPACLATSHQLWGHFARWSIAAQHKRWPSIEQGICNARWSMSPRRPDRSCAELTNAANRALQGPAAGSRDRVIMAAAARITCSASKSSSASRQRATSCRG